VADCGRLRGRPWLAHSCLDRIAWSDTISLSASGVLDARLKVVRQKRGVGWVLGRKEDNMRLIPMIAVAGILTLGSFSVNAFESAAPTYTRIDKGQLLLVQAKKEETLGQKVTRVWRNLTNRTYTFCARCPAPLPIFATQCSSKAKDREAARGACASQYPFCLISDNTQNCG